MIKGPVKEIGIVQLWVEPESGILLPMVEVWPNDKTGRVRFEPFPDMTQGQWPLNRPKPPRDVTLLVAAVLLAVSLLLLIGWEMVLSG